MDVQVGDIVRMGASEFRVEARKGSRVDLVCTRYEPGSGWEATARVTGRLPRVQASTTEIEEILEPYPNRADPQARRAANLITQALEQAGFVVSEVRGPGGPVFLGARDMDGTDFSIVVGVTE